MAVKNKTKTKSKGEEKKAKKKFDEEDDDEEGEETGGETEEEMGSNLDDVEEDIKKLGAILNGESEVEIKRIEIKASRPILQLKKGDKVKVDGMALEIDAHYVLIDHGKTKEMTIELFDPKTDKDYQLRYFSDQVETSLEFYELEEILYVRKQANKIEW